MLFIKIYCLQLILKWSYPPGMGLAFRRILMFCLHLLINLRTTWAELILRVGSNDDFWSFCWTLLTSNSCEIKISIFPLSAQFEAGWIASVCIFLKLLMYPERKLCICQGSAGPQFDEDGQVLRHTILGSWEDFQNEAIKRGEIEVYLYYLHIYTVISSNLLSILIYQVCSKVD